MGKTQIEGQAHGLTGVEPDRLVGLRDHRTICRVDIHLGCVSQLFDHRHPAIKQALAGVSQQDMFGPDTKFNWA